MCNHLFPGQQESQMEIVICDNEDCLYRNHPQCLKCSFKHCQNHFLDCLKCDKIRSHLYQLQQKQEKMEKELLNINQVINKRLTQILSQCRSILNKIEQFIDNNLFQDLIPINFNIDFILDVLKEFEKESKNKFTIIDDYLKDFAQPLKIYNQKQSRILQKYSIYYEQEDYFDEALKLINLSLNMNSQSLFSIYQKGNLLLKQQQCEQAYNWLFKAFLLSKKSKKKELKFQIYFSLQEKCMFKMKKYNDLIELSSSYQKEFDEQNVSMYQLYALFNKRQIQQALNEYDNHTQKSPLFRDLCRKAQQIMKDLEAREQEYNLQEEIKKKSQLKNSQINQKKDQQLESWNKINESGMIMKGIQYFLYTFATILQQDDDETVAFLQKGHIFLLEVIPNQIKFTKIEDINQLYHLILQQDDNYSNLTTNKS